MISTILYQTVDDRRNIKYVLENAPFKCTRDDAWLGEGYYFWDTFINCAHWWGKNSYGDKYMVCKTTCQYNENEILELDGNTKQIEQVRKYTTLLQAKKGRALKACAIFNFMKRRPSFKYKAIRVNAINSYNNPDNHILFKKNNKAYLDLTPPIQFCVIDKAIITTPVDIIYPIEYSEGFTI